MKQAFLPATPAAGRAANSSPAGRLGGQWWWWVSGFWLLMTLASWLEYWLFSSLEMTESLRYAALQRLPWMLISPPIIWLSFQYPLERGRWRRTLWIHLLACGVVLGVLAELAYLQGPPPFPRPAGNRGGEHGVESVITLRPYDPADSLMTFRGLNHRAAKPLQVRPQARSAPILGGEGDQPAAWPQGAQTLGEGVAPFDRSRGRGDTD